MKTLIAKGKGNQFFDVLVDDDDYERFHTIKWRAQQMGRVRYAFTPKMVGIHRLVMNAQRSQIVDHINGDGMDNRKENLRFATQSENAKNRHIGLPKIPNGHVGVTFRLSAETRDTHAAIAKKLGLSKTGALEYAIRQKAKEMGVK